MIDSFILINLMIPFSFVFFFLQPSPGKTLPSFTPLLLGVASIYYSTLYRRRDSERKLSLSLHSGLIQPAWLAVLACIRMLAHLAAIGQRKGDNLKWKDS